MRVTERLWKLEIESRRGSKGEFIRRETEFVIRIRIEDCFDSEIVFRLVPEIDGTLILNEDAKVTENGIISGFDTIGFVTINKTNFVKHREPSI
jgi:hypothetical protein